MDALALEVTQAARGNRTAYARLVDGHRSLVSSLALAIVKDVPASEEVAQDVFIRAWSSLPRLRNPLSFLPWLRQLTRNRAHSFLAQRRSEPGDALAAVVDPRPGPEARLIDLEERRALQAALEELPDEAREVLTLYYREGQSVAQVAALLGLREDAVKKRLSRARAALRGEVLARFGELAERTAPSDKLTALVLAALPQGAPLGAGAALLKSLPFGKVLVAALPGLFGAAIGIGWGMRKNLREAIDRREARSVLGAGTFLIASCAAFALTVPFVPHMAHPKPAMLALMLAFSSAISFGCFIWLPRAQARRLAQELQRDPAGAALRHAAQRRRAIQGAVVGMILGWAPVIAFLLR